MHQYRPELSEGLDERGGKGHMARHEEDRSAVQADRDDMDCDQAADLLTHKYVEFGVLRTQAGYQFMKFRGAGWTPVPVADAPTFVDLVRLVTKHRSW